MIIIISPSKGQDFGSDVPSHPTTIPSQLKDSLVLINELRKLTVKEIQNLMSVSEKIAELNFQRYKNFSTPFNSTNARPAFFAFIGDVYSGFSKPEYSAQDLDYTQSHLRILSGLYGALKPLDLIQAYRLEMKTKLKSTHGDNLYKFWQDRITRQINQALESQTGENFLINLASNEYSKAIKPKQINGNIFNIHFHEIKDNTAKSIAVFTKKARGLMSDYILRNRIETLPGVKSFNVANYKFSSEHSNDFNFVFKRPQPKVR